MDNNPNPETGEHPEPLQEPGRNPQSPESSPQRSQSSSRSPSSTTSTEDDESQSPDTREQEEDSPRLSAHERAQATTGYGQNIWHHEKRPCIPFSRQPADSALESRPPRPHSSDLHSSNGLSDGIRAPQAQFPPRGRFGHEGFGSQQLQRGDDDRRRMTQLSAVAKFEYAAPAVKTGGYRHPQGSIEPTREQIRGRKRSRSKGKQAERWDQMFDRLVEFRRIHGHCLVPNRYVHDPSLGAWVSTQRRHYKILTSDEPGVTTPMTPERASRLTSLGFAWATSDPRHVPWETRFQQLLEYKTVHGDCVVPIGWKENPRLSNWVSAQRQEYKLFRQGKKCRINADQVAALNAVGFVWEAQRGNHKKRARTNDDLPGEAASHAIAALGNSVGHQQSSLGDLLAAGRSFLPANRAANEAVIVPPAQLPHVFALMAAQQQVNTLQAAQGGSSTAANAARALSGIAAFQHQSRTAPTAPNANPFSMMPSLARANIPPHPFLQAMAQPSTSLNLMVNQNDRLAAAARDQLLSQMMAADRISRQNMSIPRQDQEVITRHLLHTLQNERAIDSMRLKMAVQRFHGISRSADELPPPVSQFSMNFGQQRNARQRFPSSPPSEALAYPQSRAGRKESLKSEASRFGVGLQVREVVNTRSEFSNDSDPQQDNSFGSPKRAVDLTREEDRGAAVLPLDSDDRKLPAKTRIEDSSVRMAFAKGDILRTGIDTITSPTTGPRGTSNQSSTRSSFSVRNDDEGVFSDADEDDVASEFLEAAKRGARH